MADNTIALQAQAPDSFKGIGSILNFANAAQQYQANSLALEKARQTFESDVAQRKAESSSAVTGARVAAETADPKIEQQRQLTAQATTAAAKAAQDLTQDQRAIVAGVVGTLGRAGIKDPEVYKRELQNLKTVNPNNPGLAAVVDNYGTVLDSMPKDTDLPKMAIGASQFLLSPSQAQASLTPAPGTLNLGGTVNPTVATPSVMGSQPTVSVGAPIAKTSIAPGQAESIETGPDGQKYIVSRTSGGAIIGNPRPLAGGTGNPATSMPRFNPGDAEAIPALTSEREAARLALQAAPNSHTNNRIIMQELDKTAATGAAGPALARIASIVGVTLDKPEATASAYDLVGKALERNAIEAAKAMGPNTNAGLESALKAQGSVAYNPSAIRKLTRLNDAIVTGAESYQPGLERAIGLAGNRGVLAKREYDQKWAQNFDPVIFEIYNAQKDSNQAEVDRIVKSLGAKRAVEIQIKAKALQSLSTTGKLPNE